MLPEAFVWFLTEADDLERLVTLQAVRRAQQVNAARDEALAAQIANAVGKMLGG